MATAPTSSRSRNVFTEKLGPLPTWVWIAAVTALGLVYYLYEKHKAGTSSTATTTTPQSQLPMFIIQNLAPTQGNGTSGARRGRGPTSVSTPGSLPAPAPAPAPTTSTPAPTSVVTVKSVAQQGMGTANVSTLKQISPNEYESSSGTVEVTPYKTATGAPTTPYKAGGAVQKQTGHTLIFVTPKTGKKVTTTYGWVASHG